MKLLYLLILSFLTGLSPKIILAQEITQTVRGEVLEAETDLPLIGANVAIYNLSGELITGSSTDENGRFKLEEVPVGRQEIQVSYVGYQSVKLSNILVVSGKETVLTIMLEPFILDSEEVEVVADDEKAASINEMATVSTRQFSLEESQRYAGSRGDVSRMAANFAGVAASNDNRNDIIIRGNSPLGLLWRLEGVDIPNPNHFGGFGTTGGPVSMLNANVLANSDFFTAAFPAEYGNANAGVFDLRMRKGNNEQYEFMAQMGFNGLELGAEGPLSRKSGASFLANYRYSTLGLMALFGLDFGLTGIPQYQDLSFKFHLPTTKAGQFTVFGLGGISSIALLESKVKNHPGFGEDTRNGTKMGVIGLRHKYFLKSKAYTDFILASTVQQEWTNIHQLDHNNEHPDHIYEASFLQTNLSARFNYHQKINARLSFRSGLTGKLFLSNFVDSVKLSNQFQTIRDIDGQTSLGQIYTQAKYKLHPKFYVTAGLYGQYLFLNDSYSIEPRAAIAYEPKPGSRLSAAYGQHAQMQLFPIYFNQTRLPNKEYLQSNKDLGFTKSQHVVLAYDQQFAKDFRIRLESYYQSLTQAPVKESEPQFSILNYGTNFGLTGVDSLVNEGLGRNYGIELTIEKFFSKGYYFLLTTSVFQSEYQGYDGVWRNTQFNGNFVINALLGYELTIAKNNLLSLDLKTTVAGGRRYTEIDLDASNLAGEAVYKTAETFEAQYPTYIKPDIQISFRNNMKKYSQIWSLSFENFINRSNILSYSYDANNQEIDTQYQLGIFPMMMYRIEF